MTPPPESTHFLPHRHTYLLQKGKKEWAMQVLFQSANRFVITTWCTTEKSSEDPDFCQWHSDVLETLPEGFAEETVHLGKKKHLNLTLQILGPDGPENPQQKPSDNSE